MSKPVEAVVVIVGAVPPGHLTPVNVAVLDPVPSWISLTINEVPDVAVGMVNVQLPVKVYDRTVPEDKLNVTAVLELVIDGAVSRYAVIVGLVSVLFVSVCVDASPTNVSVVLGRVIDTVTASVGVIVVAPLVAPFNTTDPMIYP
jgi:hypothetical protein